MRITDLLENGFQSYAFYKNYRIRKFNLFKKIKFISNSNLKENDYFGYKTLIYFKVVPNKEVLDYAKINKINILYSDLFLNDFSLHLLDISNNSIFNNAKHLEIELFIDEFNYSTLFIKDDIKTKIKKTKIKVKNYHGLGIPLFYLMCKINQGDLKLNYHNNYKYKATFSNEKVVLTDLTKTLYILFNSQIDFNFKLEDKKNNQFLNLKKSELLKKYNKMNNENFFNDLNKNIKF